VAVYLTRPTNGFNTSMGWNMILKALLTHLKSVAVLSASLADVSAPLADVSAHFLRKQRRQFTSPDQPIRSCINLHLIRFFFIGLISNCFNTSMGWNMILKALWFQFDLSQNLLPSMILAAQNCLKSEQSSQLNYGQMIGNLCSTLV
jgi:hypothetical protein